MSTLQHALASARAWVHRRVVAAVAAPLVAAWLEGGRGPLARLAWGAALAVVLVLAVAVAVVLWAALVAAALLALVGVLLLTAAAALYVRLRGAGRRPRGPIQVTYRRIDGPHLGGPR